MSIMAIFSTIVDRMNTFFESSKNNKAIVMKLFEN